MSSSPRAGRHRCLGLFAVANCQARWPIYIGNIQRPRDGQMWRSQQSSTLQAVIMMS